MKKIRKIIEKAAIKVAMLDANATLGFRSLNYVESQTVGGWWSPDSAGRYTYAY